MPRTHFSRPSLRSLLPAAATLAFLLLGLHADQPEYPKMPQWWTDYKVLTPNATKLDYSAINQGQLKQMAVSAYEHLRVRAAVLGGIGDTTVATGHGRKLKEMVEKWVMLDPATGAVLREVIVGGQVVGYSVLGTGNYQVNLNPDPENGAGNHKDYSAVNIGALKAVAAPFYARLNELYSVAGGYPVPWLGAANPAKDYAVANIGQLKTAFNFDLLRDDDEDGLVNIDELSYGLDPRSNDADGDGLSDTEERTLGRSPTRKDHPALTLSVSGFVVP